MSTSIGIVGAGLAGRLLGLELSFAGWKVSLFDRDHEDGSKSCTYASAGMLAPGCELEKAESPISLLGKDSLERWPKILERLDEPVQLSMNGSLVVAHPGDQEELQRFQEKICQKSSETSFMETCRIDRIKALEPQLEDRFSSALFFPNEGHIDNRQVLNALRTTLKNQGAAWHGQTEVESIGPHSIQTETEIHRFDWVADTRGMGARDALPDLRGVRGELIYVSAPDVHLTRPVRLMHPRYPIYIVPRTPPTYLIGATEIESEDYSPISIRSTLELLSAAYAVHPGFAEARVVETVTHCRPAFPNNRPKIQHKDGLIRINGLYRHGFLVSPTVVALAVDFLRTGSIDRNAHSIMEEIGHDD